ncbi:type II toxin-antitoxin system HipA family toxin [Pseudomonas sp. R5(2019)]|uniref:type II toxin-antitoxin system HipA family toxin n=1 Tax=Pseudomonas sp. R5(2019) TaxID=2697566 RepID=UPI00141305C1|nr:type II toxin-antitoxin system HipA family toxin [Pseudomonas sp. R5(2019)]NBA97165.1 type II toxin-antitoxin system HipA family toxin [Pseudomonas sp. R5(2019)]
MSRVYVYMQMPESLEVVTLGRLDSRAGVGEFVYNPEYVDQGGWVPDPIRYPLRPEAFAAITTNNGIPGFIRDAAPDGWGERVLQKTADGALDAMDFLLKSPNQDRAGSLMMGATRMAPINVGQAGVARITALDDFIAFVDNIQNGFKLSDEMARQALRQRSSLGGARPKCTLRVADRLILAKPRDRHDDFDIPALEFACMSFAAAKGLNVAHVQLHRARSSTLLVDRFDRRLSEAGKFLRIPMLSALTLLDSDWKNPALHEREWRYGLLVDELRRREVPAEDLHELYRRICFNILVGNDDDHPKNHGVIFKAGRWRLSPLYDVVPCLDGAPPPRLAMAVGKYGHELSRRNLLSQAEHYLLNQNEACSILEEVASWEPDLREHYAEHLADREQALALSAMGGQRLIL